MNRLFGKGNENFVRKISEEAETIKNRAKKICGEILKTLDKRTE